MSLVAGDRPARSVPGPGWAQLVDGELDEFCGPALADAERVTIATTGRRELAPRLLCRGLDGKAPLRWTPAANSRSTARDDQNAAPRRRQVKDMTAWPLVPAFRTAAVSAGPRRLPVRAGHLLGGPDVRALFASVAISGVAYRLDVVSIRRRDVITG